MHALPLPHNCANAICVRAGGNSSPAIVPGGQTFKLISTGVSHTCAIRMDGAAVCWGALSLRRGHLCSLSLHRATNTQFEVLPPPSDQPTGSRLCRLQMFNITAACLMLLFSGCHHWYAGTGSNGRLGNGASTSQSSPVAVSGGRIYSVIAAGQDHSCAVETSTNKAYCWGAQCLLTA